MFVPLFSYTVTEYDAEKPWLVISTGRHQVELADARSFMEWAHERWPSPRYAVQLDPWSDFARP
jgi:hypothetical protein